MRNTAASGTPLLEVSGLKKHYPVNRGWFQEKQWIRAVDGVSFSVYPGETFGVVGESGCGKSTMGQMVMQLLEPTEGEIRFEGKLLNGSDAEAARRLRRDMQIVFQDPFSSLNPRMKAFDIIAEPLQVHGLAEGQKLRNDVFELLETVGLGRHHADRYPHEFSGGQRQRIGIARALASKPKLIVCDEAVSALDVSIQAQILNLLKDLQRQFQLTYIFIAHGLPSVMHISDRVAVMYLGKIVEVAGRDELLSNPTHPYTQALLSAVPVSNPSLRTKRKLLTGDLPNPMQPPKGCAFHSRCPYARDVCRERAPELEERAPGHASACHFPADGGSATH